MSRKTATLVTLVIVLMTGCGQVIDLDEPDSRGASIEASVVSPPDEATVINYNSSKLDSKSGIKEIVREKVDFYKNGGVERGVQRPINSTVLEEYRDLETSYIEYRGVVVRLALLQEQED